ncbi:hypothetical protein IFM89_038473 [Coptis chinensis]|uniref:BUD13 homolog n=2 Tax=Coptis chinensis TaxID=261450 RepID=A0A835H8N0_9MAGN|nr:hypothetical protein IFM89_038473 [Coptis chinensis]
MKTSDSSVSRKEYLKKYVDNIDDDKKKKKTKKKKPLTDSAGGVLVVDEDPVWAKPVQQIEEDDNEDDSADEEKPQVNEDIEVRRMKRMEMIRSRRPYHAISEDGSGWIAVSNSVNHHGNQSPVQELQGKKRLNSISPDNDLSPMRRSHSQTNERSDSPDLSPPRRNRISSQPSSGSMDEDISPPRRNRANVESVDISPPRRNRPISQKIDSLPGDISPPRRNRPTSHKSDASAEDISPPRRNRSHPEIIDASKEDVSPRRNFQHSQKSNVSGKDLSPPRKSKVLEISKSFDLSPPRKNQRVTPLADLSPPRRSKSNSKEEARTGLLTAEEIKMEIERKRKEELSRYKQLDPSMSGRGAEPVFRDKEGKRMSKEEVLKLQKGEEKPKEKKLEWGKGLAQKREAEAREHELELERERPFARTKDDPELDKMLKERVRWGDPMAHLVKRKHSDLILEDLGDNEKMKESGFIIPQKVPNHSWIVRRIDAAPNRYGIKPGRHWDGVDRSNGYEKEYFKRTNEKQATEREAYLWSVSDM